MPIFTIGNQETFASHHDGGQHTEILTEIYAVPTAFEEEKNEVVDLASTQIGTLEESTASAAVIDFNENEVDDYDARMTRDLKLAAYSGYYARDTAENSITSHNILSSPQATIVAIAENEQGDLSIGAVHATFVGQDYAPSVRNSLEDVGVNQGFSVNESELDISADETAEATVIDSAPFRHRNDIPDWKVNGEARVMSGESSTSTYAGCKMSVNEFENHASIRSDHLVDSGSEGIAASIAESEVTNEVVTASLEAAEVLGFREIHPNEFPNETTQAELILQIPTITAAEASVLDGQYENVARLRVETQTAPYEDNVLVDAGGVEIPALASQQAEVLAIQEDVHPHEFPNDAEAQFVGQLVEMSVTEYHCRSTLEADQWRDGPDIMESAHFFDETSAHTSLRERSDTGWDQSTGLGIKSCYEAPSNEDIATTEHAEAVLVSSHASLSHAAEAVVLPISTGVGADSGWPEKPPGNYVTDYDPDDALESFEPFESPTRSARHDSNGMETPDPIRSSDRPGVTSSAQRAAMHQPGALQVSWKTSLEIQNLVFGGRRRSGESGNVEAVVPRTLLPWSVIPNSAANTWTATIQTNQHALDRNDRLSIAEANKSLRAFLLPTEKAAVALARAWTPPRMKEKGPGCHICSSRFALLRRPCHCRNCGVVICKECSVSWPSKMLPDTYNIKKENSLNICRSCDWLSSNFRLALLEGNQDRAVALHATGNINLHAPFGNVKGELLYPVHCAVLGGSLPLLKWLVDEQSCPIKSLRLSGNRESGGSYTPILTSKGRSLLGIALENRNVDIVRYLVVRKGNLDRVLHLLPENVGSSQQDDSALDLYENMSPDPISRHEFHELQARSISDEARDLGGIPQNPELHDDCIICFDSKIDCVATPCGHQICCLTCSQQVTRCPVCSSDCTFMRVFKP